MENTERPLVTFAVIAYNQEKYIREAIEGAFSQTYSPLEIILSDDNSPDSTFSIMEEMASNYSGPHKIILNRNNPNRGIGGHINRMMELSSGEFIVVNAGDDISVPERTEEMVIVWLDSNRAVKSIFSNVYKVDLNSNILNLEDTSNRMENLSSIEKMVKSNGCVLGASHGWDRDIFEFFGALDSRIVHEDCVLPLRSLLIGRISHIDKPLLYYRVGGISENYIFTDVNSILYGKYLSIIKCYLVEYKQKLKDYSLVNEKRDNISDIICSKISYYNLYAYLGDGKSNDFFEFIKSLKRGSFPSNLKIYIKYKLKWLYSLILNIKY